MSAPYRRELKAKDIFEAEGMECFVPMRYEIIPMAKGRHMRRLVPAVASLIFVKGRREEIQRVKTSTGVAQYLTRPEQGRNLPILVPDSQMEVFRKAVEDCCRSFLYLHPSDVDLTKGKRVRITDGALKGVCGTFMRVKGSRNRRLVVLIEGICAVAAEVDPDYIELI